MRAVVVTGVLWRAMSQRIGHRIDTALQRYAHSESSVGGCCSCSYKSARHICQCENGSAFLTSRSGISVDIAAQAVLVRQFCLSDRTVPISDIADIIICPACE